jgi:hypothetical protein
LQKEAKPVPAALGFRVKSGWAMAALLVGPMDEPRLVTCKAVLLSDPNIPQSKQPYHAALELPENEERMATRKLTSVVRAAAAKSVKDLLKEAAALQYEVRGAALVVGSVVDPATLHNEHIRAHGLEGKLFRTALEDALRRQGISCLLLVEKTAYSSAAPLLRKTERQAKAGVAKLGESHEGSWRSEEKLAALAAWVALHGQRTE